MNRCEVSLVRWTTNRKIWLEKETSVGSEDRFERRRKRMNRKGPYEEGTGKQRSPWLAPLVICSFDIIAASYSEAHQSTYLADYLSTDSACLIPLLSSYPVPVSFSAPPEILPLYTSFFVTLATKNAACPIDEPAVHREACLFESSASVVIDAPQKHSSEKVSGLPWRCAKRELAYHRFIETIRL